MKVVSVTYKVILTDHSITLFLLYAIGFPLKFDGYAYKTNSFALTAPEFLKNLKHMTFIPAFRLTLLFFYAIDNLRATLRSSRTDES